MNFTGRRVALPSGEWDVRCNLGEGRTSTPPSDPARFRTAASKPARRGCPTAQRAPPGCRRLPLPIPAGVGGPAGRGTAALPVRPVWRERRAPFPGSILSRHLLSQPSSPPGSLPGTGDGGGCVSSLLHKRAPRRRPGSGGLFLGAAPGIRWPC